MKKQILMLSAILATSSVLFLTGCSEDDTTAPVLTVKGSNPAASLINVNYTDEGATATDEKDGDLTGNIVTTNNVNKNTAGSYMVNYSVADAAGNSANASRDVYVIDLSGSYTVLDGCFSPAYTDVITVTGGTNINWAKFGNYQNAVVNGTINGSTVTIPSQTVASGSPGNVANRTFSGTGTLSFSISGGNITRKIEMPYTEVTNGASATCTATYTK